MNGEHVNIIGALVDKYVDDRVAHEVGAATGPLHETIAGQAETLAEQSTTIELRDATIATQARDLTEARVKIGELTERIRVLENGEEPPASPRPFVGACPLTGGMNSTGVSRVTSRFSAGAAVRLFSPSGWTQAPPLGNAGRLMLSWRPDLSRPIDEAACLAALATAPSGSKVAVWHEPDVKVRDGGNPIAPMKARAAEFYRIVKANRPDLDVMAVLSGWTFEPGKGFNPLHYVDLSSFDVLAVDLDGISGPKDYRPVTKEILSWMAANGVKRWTVAEYGVKTTATFTAADRLSSWLKVQTDALLALPTPPEEIAYFENDDKGGEKSKYIMSDAEIQAWRAYIKG